MNKKSYPSYEEAKKIVVEKGISGKKDYNAQYKALGLPSTPSIFYKDSGWTNWYDFLGKETKVSYPSYEEAKKIVMEKGISSKNDYSAQYNDLGLPSAPNLFYKDSGWTNWYDFLGKETKVSYPSYEEAKKIVMDKGISGVNDYKAQYKDLGLPANPHYKYKDSGWTNWYDFLGKKSYPSYEKAKKIVMEKGISGKENYHKQYKDLGLPADPYYTYKDSGWTNWYEFLGKETKVSYPSYEEAKKIVMEKGISGKNDYYKQYKVLGLPANPNIFYKDSGWTNWYDFLGKETPVSSSNKKYVLISTLLQNQNLLKEDSLKCIYVVALKMNKKFANMIDEMLKKTSIEEKLKFLQEQLKSLKVNPNKADTSNITASDELSAMELLMKELDDSETGSKTQDINTILENYYHSAINKALIAEDD